MSLLVPPADLAAFFTGQPLLLVLEELAGAEALAMEGLGLWLVARQGEAVRLYRPGSEAVAATHSLPAVPASVLGVIAPDAAAAAPLLRAWGELAAEPPVLLVAASGEAALPLLARRAVAALAGATSETARLHRGLVATRRDCEETRTVVMALEQSIGHDIPTPPNLTLETAPGEGLAVRLEAEQAGHVPAAEAPVLVAPAVPVLPIAGDRHRFGPGLHALGAERGLELGQMLNLPVDGICTIALHLAEARLGPAARLRVRLHGMESGRVLAAWLLPGEDLAPGWLTLDLAAPVEPLRETAALDISAELPPGDVLALSQEAALVEPARAVQQPGGPAQTHALAVRVWVAPQGRRFCLPQYWDWEQLDLPLPPIGVPVVLPAQTWEGCRLTAGQGGLGTLGGAPPRPMLRPMAGREAMALLPFVPVEGLDLLEASLVLQEGEGAGLEAALWLQPAGCAATAPAELSLAVPGARCSGWRALEAGQERLSIAMRLPLDGPPAWAVALVLRRPVSGVGPCAVEWAELLGRRLGRLVTPGSPPGTLLRAEPDRPPAASRAQSEPGLVQVQEHYATPDGGYRHLDLMLKRPRIAGLRWPVLRFKLALSGGAAQLEFRLRPDWPLMFERWPGRKADEHGPVFAVPEGEAAAILAGEMPSPRDARTLRAVLLLLPRVIASLDLPPEAGDPAPWLGAAERLAGAAA